MQARAFNIQVFIELVCYSLFGGLMLYLVISGQYLSYVTPRLLPYLCFTAIVMILWAITGFFRLNRPQYKKRFTHCLVLLIPILLLLLPHSPLSASNLSANYAGGSFLSQDPGKGNSVTTPINAPSPGSASPSALPTESASAPTNSTPANTQPSNANSKSRIPGLDVDNKKITVGNDDFYPWLAELFENIDTYEGYTITITGFVFKDSKYFAKNEFVPARLAMTCCTADLAPIGMLCIYDKASELKTDSWVIVEGTIFRGQYDDQDEPQIKVTKVTPTNEVKGYIYPY